MLDPINYVFLVPLLAFIFFILVKLTVKRNRKIHVEDNNAKNIKSFLLFSGLILIGNPFLLAFLIIILNPVFEYLNIIKPGLDNMLAVWAAFFTIPFGIVMLIIGAIIPSSKK